VASELLTEIYAYCTKAGLNRTQFGLKVMNDGHFISRVERGRIPEIQTIDKVHSYINGSTKAVKPFKGEK
jgi:hypothetical protein